MSSPISYLDGIADELGAIGWNILTKPEVTINRKENRLIFRQRDGWQKFPKRTLLTITVEFIFEMWVWDALAAPTPVDATMRFWVERDIYDVLEFNPSLKKIKATIEKREFTCDGRVEQGLWIRGVERNDLLPRGIPSEK